MNKIDKKLTIGIPRALYTHYYEPIWRTFFKEIGCNVKISSPTKKNIIDKGVTKSVDEICIPMKIFIGHVMELISNEVDYVFIPLLKSIKKNETFCPKFLGLPDMTKALIPDIENKILTGFLDGNDEYEAHRNLFMDIAKKLKINKKIIKKASDIAIDSWKNYKEKLLSKIEDDDKYKNNITIGIIGYPYILYDTFMNQSTFNYLKRLGVRILTFENFSDNEIEKAIQHYDKKSFWSFTNKMLGSADIWFKNKGVDGIIHLTAFACGIDAMLGQYIDNLVMETNKPFITIRLDEHSGEAHNMTRLEAFFDLLSERKMKKSKTMK